MRILGVDPGLGRLGWGVIEAESNKQKAISYGCIETPTGMSDEKRLLIIYKALKELIKTYQPEVVAVEELFFSRNVTTAFMVGQARGVILLAAAESGLSVATHAPSQVKLAVTGYGNAEKKQIAQMVKVILKLEKIPKLDDTTDALAVALAQAFSSKMGLKLKQ
ncbi:MAG: crossover junction endodeoxyribonuclease RuvC [Patescibacteria group bacterium]